MALFLVQHGKNLSKDVDPEKGLSDEGKKEVETIAARAKEYRLSVSAIKHSGKKRARETAEIFSGFLGAQGRVEKMEGLAPLDDVTKLDFKAAENLMLVGHLPFMEKLASYLVTGSPDRPPVVKFQNGGVVCLDRDAETDSWYLKWTLLPRID
ncbi:MAG: phosphohistidine phosphatase SixA [Desulfobacterales bacterium]|jgi:phosphohistidine phosphatase